MRMGAVLRDRRSLHQSAIDMPVDLAIRINNLFGIILADDWDGFPFALRGLETKTGIGLCCVGYALPHWSHRIHRKRSSRFLGDCSSWGFGGGLRRLVGGNLCRLSVDQGF